MSNHSKECYYEILQISRDAPSSDIRRAYKKLAIRYHPDKNPGNKLAEEQFKLIAEAYQVLSDPQKRKLYDQYGRNGLRNRDSDFDDMHDLSHARDIFQMFFGHMAQRRPQRGAGFPFDDDDAFFSDPFSDPFFTNFMTPPKRQRPNTFARSSSASSSSFSNDRMFQSLFADVDQDIFGDNTNFNTFSSSYSSMSSGGLSKSVRTTTEMRNGQRITKTETTVKYPDGRVETSVDSDVSYLKANSDVQQKLKD